MPEGCGVAATATDGRTAAPQKPQLAEPSLKGFPHDGQKLIWISSCSVQVSLFSRRTGEVRICNSRMRALQIGHDLLCQRLDRIRRAGAGGVHDADQLVALAHKHHGVGFSECFIATVVESLLSCATSPAIP